MRTRLSLLMLLALSASCTVRKEPTHWLMGDTLTMKIKLIKGALPEKFGRNSIFIDHLVSDACTTSPQPFGCT